MPSDTNILRIDGDPVDLPDSVRALKTAGSFRSFIQDVLEVRLVQEAALRAGLRIPVEDLQAASDEERLRLGLHSAADTQAWLSENALTVEDWEALLEHRILRSRLVERLLGQDAIQVRFAAIEDELTIVALSAIAVESRAKADEILDQIRGEEARFSDLARRHSHDEESRSAGGMVGWVSLASLAPELAAAVSSSKSGGETVGPIESGRDWYVLAVEAIERPRLTEEVKDQIREILLAEWLEEEKKRRRIEVLV